MNGRDFPATARHLCDGSDTSDGRPDTPAFTADTSTGALVS